MNIFVDESGQFKVHKKLTCKNNYECMVGTIVDDQLLAKLERLYAEKDKRWLRTHSQEVFELLASNNAKAFVIAYDADLCTEATVKKMRKDYINSIYQGKNHPDWMLDSINKHATILSDVSLEQFIKAIFSIKLLENMLRGIVGQSNQFDQNDLQNFPFVFDDMTEALIPTIKYFVSFAVFCYTAEKPLELDNPEKVAHLIHSEGKYFNGQDFFKNTSFAKSENSTGIRVADVVANQIYRLFRGKLMDQDILLLSRLFSSPYSFSFMHLDMDQEFIDTKVDEAVLKWVKGLPQQINL